MNVGANIRALRERQRVKQTELAKRVGISQSMICQIERGTKACTVQLAVEIAAALGCELSELCSPNVPDSA